MKKQYILFILSMFIVTWSALAQNTINGKVTGSDGEEIPGVTIVIKGANSGTTTDLEGNYTLSVPEDATLVFSFVGYQMQEVVVGSQSKIDIILDLDITQLQEVVVTGYGSQRKMDITGAVAIVDVDEMNKSQFLNVTDRLQGRVAGVTVSTGGEPGQIGEIKIRGSSFFGGNNPLYVIDGVLTDDSPNLNPNDVESIQILKDAASSAIYGSRAANGVVVITTKRGVRGKPVINLSVNAGFQQIANKLDLMNNVQWARVANSAADNAGAPRYSSADNLTGINTDWQEEVFNEQAVIQDINMSISAGGANNKVYFSLNNAYQEGTIQGPLFERLSARLNTEFELFKGLTIGENLTIGRTTTSGIEDGMLYAATNMIPTIPVYDETKLSGYGHGTAADNGTFVVNPIGLRDLYKNKGNSTSILGNLFLNYEIIDGLEYRFNFGVNATSGYDKRWWKNGQISRVAHLSGLEESRYQDQEILWENRVTYSKEIGDHAFTAMAAITEQTFSGSIQSTNIRGGFEDQNDFFQIDATKASPNDITSGGSEYESAIRSYLGRLTYNFADRYNVTAIIRHDGSSKFSEDNRWGTFPSISAGWILSEESFFKVPVISFLKFRGGYGINGNSSVGNYAYQARIRSTASDGVNYNLGPSSISVIGATRGPVVSPNISWEVLKETNIGLDLSLWEGKFELIADYYFRNLEDLITGVPLPMTVGPGGGEDPAINAVTMKSNGWEVQLNYAKMTGDFKFRVSANAFNTRNEVVSLPFGVPEFIGQNSISRIGTPLGQFFIYDYLGIYSQEDIDNLPPGFTVVGIAPEVGDAKHRDANGRDDEGNLTGQPDGQINADDRIVVDANPIPAVQFGLNFEAYYKNFDFTIFFQGVAGRDGYNQLYADLVSDAQSNYPVDFDPYIDGSGTEPRVIAGGGDGNQLASTRWLESADYLRLKNIQIGYTIPWKKVEALRVFVSAQNLFTITKYRGWDPEFEGGVFEPGVDQVGYPNLRTVTGGLSLTF